MSVVERKAARIYHKYNKGDPITDEELKYGITVFRRAVNALADMGPVFSLACKEANRVMIGLQD